MSVEWILAYLALGVVVGVMAGLLGIGGGGIMVPVLTSMFAAQGISHDHIVLLALGTSMAAIIFTAASSVYSHHRHRAILWPAVARMVPGVLVGTFAATWLATLLPTDVLAIIFAAFMGYVALQMVLNIKPRPGRHLPGTAGLSLAGAGIGAISALVAIGGGSLTVPFLTWCNVSIRQAIATSAAVGLPIAVAGAIGYAINAPAHDGLPQWTLGYVYLPAAVLISATSIFTAPIGAKLAHTLPTGVLRKIFAVLLVGLSVKMLTTIL